MTEDEHHVSVFCPPLRGDESHNPEGGYPANGPGPRTDRRLFVKRADEMRKLGHELVAANGQARTLRMLTQADDVGFGFSDVLEIGNGFPYSPVNEFLEYAGPANSLRFPNVFTVDLTVFHNVKIGSHVVRLIS